MNALYIVLGPALILGLGGFMLTLVFGDHNPGGVFPNPFRALVVGVVLAVLGLVLGILGELALLFVARWMG